MNALSATSLPAFLKLVAGSYAESPVARSLFTLGDARENLFCRAMADEHGHKHVHRIPGEFHSGLFSRLSVSQVAKRLGC